MLPAGQPLAFWLKFMHEVQKVQIGNQISSFLNSHINVSTASGSKLNPEINVAT